MNFKILAIIVYHGCLEYHSKAFLLISPFLVAQTKGFDGEGIDGDSNRSYTTKAGHIIHFCATTSESIPFSYSLSELPCVIVLGPGRLSAHAAPEMWTHFLSQAFGCLGESGSILVNEHLNSNNLTLNSASQFSIDDVTELDLLQSMWKAGFELSEVTGGVPVSLSFTKKKRLNLMSRNMPQGGFQGTKNAFYCYWAKKSFPR